MKKTKQILALLGVILLLGLYITTFILALTDNTDTMIMFKASIFATFVIPVLMWAYSLIYKLVHNKSDDDSKKK